MGTIDVNNILDVSSGKQVVTRSPDVGQEIRQLLADDISVKLLSRANDGFPAGIHTHKSMGITKKQYYPRLTRLRQLNLIEKVDMIYTTTNLGRIIFKTQVQMLEELSANRDHVEIMQAIRAESAFQINKEKANSIAMSLLENTNVLKHLFVNLNRYDIDVLTGYESSIAESCKAIANAKSKVVVVSRFVHPDAVTEMMRAANYNNVKVSTIIAEEILAKRISGLHITTKEQLERSSSLIFPAKASNVKYRYSNVRYSFMVVDGITSIIEILNPFDSEFLLAVKFNSKEISQRVMETFDSIWQHSKSPHAAALDIIAAM